MKIPFNKPYLSGKETQYIEDAVQTRKISGNGKYTQLCQAFFRERFGFAKCLLTTSCTDALEMCSLLLDLKPGDEVIIPSYTFVSTANPFLLRGAKPVFADSLPHHPNIDPADIEHRISPATKAIVVVHYAGVACDMDPILEIARKHNLFVIEDAAQAIESSYKGKPLGSIGDLAAFSFHETKNIQCGEGGMLVVNNPRFFSRAEIIWEKGTNRVAFFRGEVDKYGWVDVGSSFLPSEVVAAFLFAQLENLNDIQTKRIQIWKQYQSALQPIKDKIGLPFVPDFATNNGHLFYLLCNSLEERTALISVLKEKGIWSVFHYLSLHKSPYYTSLFGETDSLPNSDLYSDHLLRLPLFYELSDSDVKEITDTILHFFQNRNL